MSANIKLFCWAYDDRVDQMFPVQIPLSDRVADLKEAIRIEKPKTFQDIETGFLRLYKVDIPLDDFDDFTASSIQLKDDQSLLVTKTISTYWSTQPDTSKLHVVVRSPDNDKRKRIDSPASDDVDRSKRNREEPASSTQARRHSPPMAPIRSNTARRSSTVDALYQRLDHYHFVMVRGTPASGKSTLAQLLEIHIRAKEPAVDPIVISSWPRDNSPWTTKLTENYDNNGPNTIIIDEAQLTYWDDGFWNSFLKPITPRSLDRVILFVSYGSPLARVSVQGTSMVVPDRQRISLRPVERSDEIPPAGLLLQADEFSEMVKAAHPMDRFTTDFLDYVFRFTAGHGGAVCDLLHIVVAHKSYRQVKHEAGEYSLEIFQSQFPITELWSGLELTSIFRRGLPMLFELQDPHIALVFRKVLSNNNVTKQMLDAKEDQDALELCFNNGWLHATTDRNEIVFIFTTPLHQWFVEYHLGNQLIDSTLIMDQDLRTFAFKVMRLFSHRRLSSPRKIGASNLQRPPEARFQDEFYRCCHKYSQGSLISFPEYGGARGRIDFYIPSKKWGVELLRDGDRLENHSSRFTGQGAHTKIPLEDYIILDFRVEPPQKKHPGIPNLYHVVFENGFKRVGIQEGSSLQTLDEFELLNHN